MTKKNTSHKRDGDPVESLHPQLQKHLTNEFGEKAAVDKSLNFVGLVWSEDKFYIFWPKGYLLPEKNWEKGAKLLVNCLTRSEKTYRRKMAGINPKADTSIHIDIEVLENYQQSGLYVIKNREYRKIDRGNINWSRTIKQCEPFFANNNTPIYFDPIVSVNVSSDEAIRIIHADIVRQCDNSVGWLVANKGNKVAPSLQHIRSRFSTTTALSLIRQERHKQYSEDRLFQLSLMEQFFLNKLGDPENSWKCVGTVNFQTIWEKMCQNYFRDQKDRLRTPATPAYLHKNNDMTPRKVNSPKPDIIIFEGEYIGIIDAKYYDLDKTWPNWTDMVKQFFYAKAYSRDTAFKNINNLFALPENSNMSHKAVVVLNHKQQQLDDEFPPIKLLFLDINEVMENYVSRRSSSSSRDLVFGS